MVDELMPHAVGILILQQGRHHGAVGLQDAGALGVIVRQLAEQLGHATRHPAIAAAPEEGELGPVIEQAVGLLELVQVGDHFERGPVEVNLIAGGAPGLELEDRDHVHVVDPEAGFAGEALRRGVLPLLVGQLPAEIEVLRVLGADVQLQRDDAEDGVIDMALPGDQLLLSLFGPVGIVALDQGVGHGLVAGEFGEFQGGVPGGVFGVVDPGFGGNPAREHVLNDLLADFLRRGASRPVRESLVLGRGDAGEPKDQDSGDCMVNEAAHGVCSQVSVHETARAGHRPGGAVTSRRPLARLARWVRERGSCARNT